MAESYYQRDVLKRTAVLKDGASLRRVRCDGQVRIKGEDKDCGRILYETNAPHAPPSGKVIECPRCHKRHPI